MSPVTETTPVESPQPPAAARDVDPPAPARASSPPADAERSTTESVLGVNRDDQRVVTVLILIALVLMAVHWYRLMHHRPAPIEVLHPAGYRFQLDVNTATWVEWMQLDGIGETLARRIVADRQQQGPFAAVEDIQRVHGIGPRTLERLRPHLTCQPLPDE